MTINYVYPIWNLIRIDRKDHLPIHEQVFRQLHRFILSNDLLRGSRLPASRQLAKELQISRNTVLQAYARLSSEGYIRQHTGRGTFVELELPEDFVLTKDDKQTSPDLTKPKLSDRGRMVSHFGVSWDQLYGFDLSPHLPAMNSFPFKTFKQLFNEYWHQIHASDLVYGEPGGFMELRIQIAIYLGEVRGIHCDPEQIIVSANTLSAVNMAATMLLDAGDKVVFEDPCNVTQIALLKSLGLVPIGVRCDREGLNLCDPPADTSKAHMVIVTPVGQFPFGSNLSEKRVQAIRGWAHENNAWVIEDESNNGDYRWAGQPRMPLAASDLSEQVIYINSFNRVLGPGFRLAYMVVPHRLIDSFTTAQQMSGFHASTSLQRVMAEFMQQGLFAHHLRRHRIIYKKRAQALHDGLKLEFGDFMDVPKIETGLQLTAVFNKKLDDVAISKAALKQKLDIPPLSPCCMLTPKLQGLLFGFGNTPVARIGPAIRRLRQVIDQLQDK